MSRLTLVIGHTLLYFLCVSVMALANVLGSMFVVLVVVTFLSDFNTLFNLFSEPLQIGFHGTQLLIMNVVVFFVGAVGLLGYKLATLFDNVDFSFDRL